MPRRKKATAAVPFTASDLANITKTNPYIQRLIEDAELRENVRAALEASRSAYERLANGKAPHRALLEDRKLHKDLRVAAEALRGATMSLTEAPKKARKRRRLGRKLLIILVGGVVALTASEKLRSKVLDTLFGAEEEFQYTPPASPAPASPPTSNVGAA